MSRRLLLDENLPVRLRHWMPGIQATAVEFMGWKGMRNGQLVHLARAEQFAALVTADRALALAPRSWAPPGVRARHAEQYGAASNGGEPRRGCLQDCASRPSYYGKRMTERGEIVVGRITHRREMNR